MATPAQSVAASAISRVFFMFISCPLHPRCAHLAATHSLLNENGHSTPWFRFVEPGELRP
jgi:hypothetical protein